MDKNGVVLIISARFHEDVSKILESGAKEELEQNGFIEVVERDGVVEIKEDEREKYRNGIVKGGYAISAIRDSYEIPEILVAAAKSGKYAGFVLLGCFINGQISNDTFLFEEMIRKISEIKVDYGIPVGTGVLFLDNMDQVTEIADKSIQNKGVGAVKSMISAMNALMELNTPSSKIVIISARYRSDISDLLEKGAIEKLKENGLENYDKIDVPGSFEIPVALSMAVKSRKYHGFLTLGCTINDAQMYNNVVSKILDINIQHGVATGIGIPNINNSDVDEAVKEAKIVAYDRGAGAASAMINMLDIRELVSTKLYIKS